MNPWLALLSGLSHVSDVWCGHVAVNALDGRPPNYAQIVTDAIFAP